MTVRRTKLNIEHYDLGSLRLYREDLRAIAAAAAEAGDLFITCDGFEATSPDDFSDELPEKPENVTITAKRTGSPSVIDIRLTAEEASVRLTEADTLLAGIVSRIQLICDQRRRPLRSLFGGSSPLSNRWRSYGAILLVGVGVYIAIHQIASIYDINSSHVGLQAGRWNLSDILVLVIVGIAVLGVLGYIGITSGSPRVVIINAPRATRPTYWERTHDMWLVGIITALFGAAAGYMLGKLG